MSLYVPVLVVVATLVVTFSVGIVVGARLAINGPER